MKLFSARIAWCCLAAVVWGIPSKGKDNDDYVSLRISVRVMGQFTGNSSMVSDEGSVKKTYQDSYTTAYTSVTKWKVIALDQANDVAVLKRISDQPDVSGSGQGAMTGINKFKVYGPWVNGKRKESWQTETMRSSWVYKFPETKHLMPAQVRLHKRAKSFRIELNAVGPDMPKAEGQSVIEYNGPNYNGSRTLDQPMAFNIGDSMGTLSQTAAIPLDKSEKRLTGEFNPEKPFEVSGTAVFNASEVPLYQTVMNGLKGALGEGGSVQGDGKLYVSYTLAWDCEPTDIDAIIVPAGLESWLPAASPDGSEPGNAIGFTLRLVDKKTGKPPEDRTAYFKCDLSDVSKEPGSCMNSLWTGTDPDLKFLSSDNPEMETVSGDGQSATSKKKLKTCSLSVSCYDGAAYGRLQVVAYLDDGRAVMAHVEGKPAGMDVTIPSDEDNNRVADCWEDANGVRGKSPSADDDEQPLGDHDKGDGLTVWEEYRGFVEDGKHFRTDPNKKDFFICDTIGGKCKRGINRFAALTKLDVHDKLTPEELSEKHVINRNRSGDAPHVVDQHGIIITTWSIHGVCEAVGNGPGTPKSCKEVCIDDSLAETVTRKVSGGITKTYEYYAPTVAHEILHCCNVWHHGESDEHVTWRAETVRGVTAIYEYANAADCGHPEKGHIETVFAEEDDSVYVPTDRYWSTPHFIWLGRLQGEHSGNEDCVMRYDFSNACVSRGGDRYLCQEPVGQGLCTSRTGTGVNASDRKPVSRYNDATRDRGDCVDKVCVNDLYHFATPW